MEIPQNNKNFYRDMMNMINECQLTITPTSNISEMMKERKRQHIVIPKVKSKERPRLKYLNKQIDDDVKTKKKKKTKKQYMTL